MLLPPIIERELRVALRKRHPLKSRLHIALGATVLVSCFLLLSLFEGPKSMGRTLHTFLFYAGLYLALIPPSTISVALFSEERRNQTLELLYLSGISSSELFIGKLASGILNASSDLLVLCPFLTIPFLSGGVSLDLYLATIACFPTLLLFVVTAGLLASVLSTDDGSALFTALLLAAGVALAPFLPYWLGKAVTGSVPFSTTWLCLSPASVPYFVITNFSTASPAQFWKAVGMTWGWSLVFLFLAAWLLKRKWKQELEKSGPTGWRALWDDFVNGSSPERWKLRSQLLDANPFRWLVQQNRRPVMTAWASILFLCFIWLLGWWAWPHLWPSTMNFYITALVMIVSVNMIMNYAAACRIGNDRRDGALELLLTTPLKEDQIVEGQIDAIKAQFQSLRFTVLGLCLVMMVAGLFTRTWTVNAVISYLLIWGLFVIWCIYSPHRAVPRAMWIALNSGRPMFALFRLQTNIWGWVWLVINGRNMSRALTGLSYQFPSGSVSELVLVCFGSVMFFLIFAAFQQSPSELLGILVREMRSIAQEPVPEPNDPRFKKWDVRQRLPPAT
jgi:ABC-type transport system involved in cytochrome c biogenesis permease component